MRIDKEYVVEQAQETLKKLKLTEQQYLEKVTKGFIPNVLMQSPCFWKNYGMYWWNVQEILKNYAPSDYRKFLDFVGGDDMIGRDDEIKERYDYGSDTYNWVAAALYVMDRADSMELGDEYSHEHETPDGDWRMYKPGTGFVDERET